MASKLRTPGPALSKSTAGFESVVARMMVLRMAAGGSSNATAWFWPAADLAMAEQAIFDRRRFHEVLTFRVPYLWPGDQPVRRGHHGSQPQLRKPGLQSRSEERRVGKGCRSRWTPD